MAEKTKKGPPRKHPDSAYVLAYELFVVQDLSAFETAKSINAKEICDRLDSQHIRSMAAVGKRIREGGK